MHLSAALKAVDVLSDIISRLKKHVNPGLLTKMGLERLLQEVPGVILRSNQRLQVISGVDNLICDPNSPEISRPLSSDGHSLPRSPSPPSECSLNLHRSQGGGFHFMLLPCRVPIFLQMRTVQNENFY